MCSLFRENQNPDSFSLDVGQRAKWITIFDSPFYPDFLAERRALHMPTVIEFRRLVNASDDSRDLYRRIMNEPNPARTQLTRIFRKYVSPDTSVEMLKRKNKTEETIANFSERFRLLVEVRERLLERPEDDEALFAILGEYDTRGQKGYDLTGVFFEWFEVNFESLGFRIDGPSGAGSDLLLNTVLPGYRYATPADFVIWYNRQPIVAGFARYDTDRGGSQEDDRVKGNERHATQVLGYRNPRSGNNVKVLLINDGPGLLLGSMWDDYGRIEQLDSTRIMVCTLLMLDYRVTQSWLLG